MTLPLRFPYPVMEAQLVDAIPEGDWQFEPKWDGFRCLAFRDGDEVVLQSKKGEALERYFPEVVAALRSLKAKRFVLDGEIVVPVDGRLSFDDLLQRIHPAESRVRKLSVERPAVLIAFDLLVDDRGRLIADEPMPVRRTRLEAFAAAQFGTRADLQLSPATRDRAVAEAWLASTGDTLDGVVAKRVDVPYRSGERTGMRKVKRLRTADCVVGGFRWASGSTTQLGSYLLGLYGDDGLLHHVGFSASFTAAERPRMLAKLKPLRGGGGFDGTAPGGPSRWSTERSAEWEPVRPEIVVEVRFDHFTGGRFRHGTKILRFRPDKDPRTCTFEQVEPPRPAARPAKRRKR